MLKINWCLQWEALTSQTFLQHETNPERKRSKQVAMTLGLNQLHKYIFRLSITFLLNDLDLLSFLDIYYVLLNNNQTKYQTINFKTF